MKDPFSHSARWDSVGLDCSNCKYFHGPEDWPDKDRESKCDLHNISLQIQLGKNGYKEGEWFCKNYYNQDAHPKSFKEFKSVYGDFKSHVLYQTDLENEELVEVDFEELNEK